jgi:transaldolase
MMRRSPPKSFAYMVAVPPRVICQLFKHPLTDAGIADFLKGWEATGQKIV